MNSNSNHGLDSATPLRNPDEHGDNNSGPSISEVVNQSVANPDISSTLVSSLRWWPTSEQELAMAEGDLLAG